MTKIEIKDQIVNFVLNVANWQIKNKGYNHQMSLHLQDIIPGIIITWIIVDNGKLYFEGMKNVNGRYIDYMIPFEDVKFDNLLKVLNILKNIDMFSTGVKDCKKVPVNITKKNANAFKMMCLYAEAYMDLHNIRKPSVNNAIVEVKKSIRMIENNQTKKNKV